MYDDSIQNSRPAARTGDNGFPTPSFAKAAPRPAAGGAPFGGALTGLSSELVAREVSTVLGRMAIAKSYPRDLAVVAQNIHSMCSRMELAESATYLYKRGKENITGPTIRLAEALAKAYQNLQYGFEETTVSDSESKVRAFAYDLETNTSAERTFMVKAENYSATSKKIGLTNSRDKYENVANQAQRRVRACILELIPDDVVQYALKCCDQTRKANIRITPKLIAKIVEVFEKLGVSKARIEARIGHSVNELTVDDYMFLFDAKNAIIEDGVSVEEFFEPEKEAPALAETARQETTPEIQKNAPEAQEQALRGENQQGPENYEDDEVPDNVDPDTGEVYNEDEDFGDAWR